MRPQFDNFLIFICPVYGGKKVFVVINVFINGNQIIPLEVK